MKLRIIFILFTFLVNAVGPMPANAQELYLPKPGVRVHLSPAVNPPLLKGIKVYKDNPFKFDFILDQGDASVIPAKAGIQQQEQLKIEANRLIKYFLASVTVPEEDLWVNLSPYEKDRIIPDAFGKTEMGRDLLAQDYLLKQITASLIYPEEQVGKEFWNRVYQEAQAKFGTTNIPVNTFNKVWIIPAKAVVYENKTTAYVVEAKLKVMLEQDYLSLGKGTAANSAVSGILPQELGAVPKLASDIVREIILPQLEREVNEGKNFAALRQVYHSLILAAWYKQKIKQSILSKIYADKKKVQGLSSSASVLTTADRPNIVGDPGKGDIEGIYQQYLKAFKKGVFNYIKEENVLSSPNVVVGDPGNATTTKKYFSGGFAMRATAAMTTTTNPAQLPILKDAIRVEANFAMLSAGPSQETSISMLVASIGNAVKEFNDWHRPMFQLTMEWSNEGNKRVDIFYPEGGDNKPFLGVEIIKGDPVLILKVRLPKDISAVPRLSMFLDFLYRDIPSSVLVTYDSLQENKLRELGIIEQQAKLRVRRFQEGAFHQLLIDLSSVEYVVRDDARRRLVKSVWPRSIGNKMVDYLVENILNPKIKEGILDSDTYKFGKSRINARLTSLYAIALLTEDIFYGSQIKALQERLVKEAASYQARPEIDLAVEAYNYNNPNFAESERALASLNFFEHLCCLAKALNKGYFVVKDRYKWIGVSIDTLIDRIDVKEHPQVGVLKSLRNPAMSSKSNEEPDAFKSNRRKVILLFVGTGLAAAFHGLYLANNGTGLEALLAGKTKEEQLFICTEEYRKRLTDASKFDPDSVRHYFYKEFSLKHLQNRMNKIAAELEKPVHTKADAILEQAKKDAAARGEKVGEHILRTFQYEKAPGKLAYGAVILFRKGPSFVLKDTMPYQWALHYYMIIEENPVTKKKELNIKFVYPGRITKGMNVDEIISDTGAQEFLSDVPYLSSPAQAAPIKSNPAMAAHYDENGRTIRFLSPSEKSDREKAFRLPSGKEWGPDNIKYLVDAINTYDQYERIQDEKEIREATPLIAQDVLVKELDSRSLDRRVKLSIAFYQLIVALPEAQSKPDKFRVALSRYGRKNDGGLFQPGEIPQRITAIMQRLPVYYGYMIIMDEIFQKATAFYNTTEDGVSARQGQSENRGKLIVRPYAGHIDLHFMRMFENSGIIPIRIGHTELYGELIKHTALNTIALEFTFEEKPKTIILPLADLSFVQRQQLSRFISILYLWINRKGVDKNAVGENLYRRVKWLIDKNAKQWPQVILLNLYQTSWNEDVEMIQRILGISEQELNVFTSDEAMQAAPDELVDMMPMLSSQSFFQRQEGSVMIRDFNMDVRLVAEQLINNFNDPSIRRNGSVRLTEDDIDAMRRIGRVESLHTLRMLLENKVNGMAKKVDLRPYVLGRLENGARLWLKAYGLTADDHRVMEGTPQEIEFLHLRYLVHQSVEIPYPNLLEIGDNKADLDFFQNIRFFFLAEKMRLNNFGYGEEIGLYLKEFFNDAKDSPAKRLSLFDQAMVATSIMHQDFYDYDRAIKDQVNPENKDLVVLYGGAGVDISHVWLSTNAAKYYMFSNHVEMNENEFRDYLARLWEDDGDGLSLGKERMRSYVHHKFDHGYGNGANIMQPLSVYGALIMELKSLGLKENDIEISTHEGNLKIAFNKEYPGTYKSRRYEFIFIKADIINPASYANIIANGFDIYYQRAGMQLAERYKDFIEALSLKLRDNGFWITDDNYILGGGATAENNLEEVLTEKGIRFLESLQFNTTIMQRIAERVYRRLQTGYGWLLSVRQKLPAVSSKKGGIDLTAQQLPLEVNKAGYPIKAFGDNSDDNGFNITPAMLAQFENATGLVANITVMEPLGDLHEFLGVNAGIASPSI